jgi:hypothetical protein
MLHRHKHWQPLRCTVPRTWRPSSSALACAPWAPWAAGAPVPAGWRALPGVSDADEPSSPSPSATCNMRGATCAFYSACVACKRRALCVQRGYVACNIEHVVWHASCSAHGATGSSRRAVLLTGATREASAVTVRMHARAIITIGGSRGARGAGGWEWRQEGTVTLRWRRAALASNDFDGVDDDVHRLPADRRVSATTADPMRHSMRTTLSPIPIDDIAAIQLRALLHCDGSRRRRGCVDAASATLPRSGKRIQAHRGPPPGFL